MVLSGKLLGTFPYIKLGPDKRNIKLHPNPKGMEASSHRSIAARSAALRLCGDRKWGPVG